MLAWTALRALLAVQAALAQAKTVEEFSLTHVLGARQALQAVRTGDARLAASLFDQTLLSGLKPGRTKVAVRTREEYLFRLGSGIRAEEGPSYAAFMERIPRLVPCPEDQETVLSFAKMAANSYITRLMEDWRNATDYTDDDGFGWNSTGLRGHIFVNPAQSIVVVSFKGTSTILNGGDTVARDKYMDNMMFSCCCARVDLSWTPVCGCYSGSSAGKSVCNKTCLRDAVQSDPDSYFHEGFAVTQLVIAKYPRAQIWFTGHSLGGAVASLMAVAVRRTAAMTFSSPGPLLYARHLGLHDGAAEGSQWQHPVWNFGPTSDPIFMGTCTGLVTSCYLSGYAMETACRHGMDCVYKVSTWQPDVATHRIDWFIDHVIAKPETYGLPTCVPNNNCTDCAKWSFE